MGIFPEKKAPVAAPPVGHRSYYQSVLLKEPAGLSTPHGEVKALLCWLILE
jgi:hypothetical protein